MPTVTFGKVAEVATETSTAVVPVSSPGAVGPVENHNAASQLVGDWGGASEATPELRLGQKTSKFVEDNPALMGKWVYAKELALGLPADPKSYSPELNRALAKDSVLGIPCQAAIMYEEKTEYGEGVIPQRWRTAAEARASGAEYAEVGIVDLLIAFDSDHEQLLVLDGKGFLKVRFYAKKKAFTQVAARIAGDAKTWLKNPTTGEGDLASGFYELAITKVTGPKGAYWVAAAKSAGHVPASLRAAIKAEFPSV